MECLLVSSQLRILELNMVLENAATLIYLLWPAKIQMNPGIEGWCADHHEENAYLPNMEWIKDLACCVINLTSASPSVLLAYTTTTNHSKRASCSHFSLWNIVYYSGY